ncbi:pre-mRNA 3' end processing protein WDR33 [Hydra vulgaris]|uniref:pre-mRNA 3' end processing protein WDR33 n=1 Tax=Hydra vulgaris TaxID=6087 RepID=T2M6C5_HYDVU|nr:pre-mRNA 3' end processing protein WDR33 [Hydra vulgaris]
MLNQMQQAQLVDQHHKQVHNRPQQQQPQVLYSVCIPTNLEENLAGSNTQCSVFKQINIIPGFDAENAVVDTGIKLVRPAGAQVHLSANINSGSNEFDGKRMRRSIQRRTVDYNASTIQQIKYRLFRRSVLQRPVSQPDPLYYPELIQPCTLLDNPMNAVTTRFVRASTNKVRCPVFSVAWTPEGRRVVTGTSSGEFTLWNGLTFNFETILQAHESSVRAMEWSHNDMWLLSGDHNGVIKYWQSNMNNVKMLQAHTDPIRGVSFCPTDNKFVTCSDDGLIKLWDFYRCQEERILRGHGADVKCIGWHPFKSMVASGSKDSQQPLKLWDPRTGSSLATIHGHKSTVMDLNWNKNGNWLLTGSRDRLLKVFDIRVMKEIYTFRGHKKEAASVNWHPLYENMFASGGSDGSIMFWLMGCEKELGAMDNAHDGMIWDLKWHPLGHILCSGSNDHTTKFWTRNRPGDKMRDKYNLNVLPAGYEDDYEYELPTMTQSEESTSVDSSLNLTGSIVNLTSTKVEQEMGISEVLRSPIIQALLQQATLQVQKPNSKETPAQIYTVPRQRTTAITFKIDPSKQKKAIEEVERLEKRRERHLSRGRQPSTSENPNAPSLLDLDIAPPPFLTTHEWDDEMKDVPFMDDIKRQQLEQRPGRPCDIKRPLQNEVNHVINNGDFEPMNIDCDTMQRNVDNFNIASNDGLRFAEPINNFRRNETFHDNRPPHLDGFDRPAGQNSHGGDFSRPPHLHSGNFERPRFDDRRSFNGPERIDLFHPENRNFNNSHPFHPHLRNDPIINDIPFDRPMDGLFDRPHNGPFFDRHFENPQMREPNYRMDGPVFENGPHFDRPNDRFINERFPTQDRHDIPRDRWNGGVNRWQDERVGGSFGR